MERKLKEGGTSLFDMSDKDLIKFAYNARNNVVMDTVAPEMMRRLKLSIEKFNKNSSRQSNRIFWLTVAMGIIAIFQLILLFTQA